MSDSVSLDAVARRVYLFGAFDEASAMAVIRSVRVLDDDDPGVEIELHLSSYGGDVYEMLAISDMICGISSPITIIATGKCQSATPILLSFGDHRIATRRTRFMIHDVSSGLDAGSNHDDMTAEADETRLASESLIDALVDNTKMGADHWRPLFAKRINTYFDPETALKWGLIDEII